jgi:MFS family permease
MDPWMLIVGRVCQGMGFAGLPLGVVIINHHFPKEKRGIANSISVASVGIGLALGPMLGSWVLAYFDWQVIFYLGVALGLICLVTSMSLIPADKTEYSVCNFDWKGVLWLFFALLPAMYGIGQVRWWGLLSYDIWGLVILAILGAIGLTKHCQRHAYPLIDLSILKNRNASFSILSRGMFMICFAAVLFVLPLQLQNIDLMSVDYAANMMLIMTLVMVIVSPFCGHIVDLIGPKKPMYIGVVFCLLAHAFFAIAPVHYPLFTGIALLLFGTAAAFMFTAGTYMMTHSLTLQQKSMGMGLFFTAANVGISLGVAMSGGLLSYLSERKMMLVMASHQWTFSKASYQKIYDMASGIKSVASEPALFTEVPALSLHVQKTFMSSFHWLMWVCFLLCLVILYLTHQLDDKLDRY